MNLPIKETLARLIDFFRVKFTLKKGAAKLTRCRNAFIQLESLLHVFIAKVIVSHQPFSLANAIVHLGPPPPVPARKYAHFLGRGSS